MVRIPEQGIKQASVISHGQGYRLPHHDTEGLRGRRLGGAGVRVCSIPGTTLFGKNLPLAKRCCGHGVRFVTVNQFSTVFDAPSWDCHADGGSLRSDLNDYPRHRRPVFDTAFAALLTDLEDRGLLDTHARRRHRRVRPHAELNATAAATTGPGAGRRRRGRRRERRAGHRPHRRQGHRADRPTCHAARTGRDDLPRHGRPADATIPGPIGGPSRCTRASRCGVVLKQC